ncbi:DUF4159 domain-containing protein [Patiriisocius sp. Uisw_017]|jgi:hypothetical protein|uniref:DUF4159 domain-containing protein n=1 Tax=Patiriisocius sp. Uisw_017 TaxID=3230968 RepID=UPI0039EC2503
MRYSKLFFFYFLIHFFSTTAQSIAVLHYGGGGDWYSNPTALPNLVNFCNKEIDTSLSEKTTTVKPESIDVFDYPFIHMTGHGNVFFTPEEAENLRNYLLSGGFLHIDDNYGMDQYLRKEIVKIFPNIELKELPGNHPIFNYHFKFSDGLPKIHEHDKARPEALAIEKDGRLLLLYTFECDLGDGWENQEVHNDPPQIRLKALQMGANIIKYAFEN